MAIAASPFRYPGGKASLRDITSKILKQNDLSLGSYAEPFAGGCGLALELLYNGCVSEIHINDIDRYVWAFWHCTLNHTKRLIDKINTTDVSIEEWRRQRDIYRDPNVKDVLQLGFATFFLNRTNRSGIIKGAGVIGGLKQTGSYKIDCRYNKDDLIKRILRIKKYSDRINLYNLDALTFLKQSRKFLDNKSLLFIDPPYFNKGAELYTNFYNEDDHARLAYEVEKLTTPWVVTYDTAPEIRNLYRDQGQFLFDLNYSAHTKRAGTELMIVSKGLKLPTCLSERPAAGFGIHSRIAF